MIFLYRIRICNQLFHTIKYIFLIQQKNRIQLCLYLILLNSFFIFIFNIEAMHIRFQHADIFHYKGLGAKIENRPDILFYQFVIKINRLIMLSIGIAESLTGRSADDNIYPAILFIQCFKVNIPNIIIPVNSSKVLLVCICRMAVFLYEGFYIKSACLLKA